ncbi:hypothetical protein G6O69_06875 [Pseudenhygromyxa sp. WMMC2535]|uniref:hypothetical protein n=1 Tax=Pseudenhygromyxa sp. WMMC2535 TaxID=2712867 RepID=UPI0015532CF4|nr:hypothetical protein [Pseudenhygromyxa sp. WMMC2535]NVB37549.1 hypothetical protein [Pseudenhygromyxa sp. WMMC2535]
MTTLKRHALLLALGLGLPLSFVQTSACTNQNEDACKNICEIAETCGMLPSPLGTTDNVGIHSYSAQQNCESRCAASDAETIAQVENCIGQTDRFTGDEAEPEYKWWCDAGGCTAAAACLESVFGDARITGTGRAKIELRGTSNINYKLDSTLSTCGDSEDTSVVLDDTTKLDTSFCEEQDIESIEIILETTDSSTVIASGGCSELVYQIHNTSLLPVGRYQLALHIYQSSDPNSSSSDTSGSCSVFYGESVTIRAGTGLCDSNDDCAGVIPLPEGGVYCSTPRICGGPSTAETNASGQLVACGYTCEDSATACSNVDDNGGIDDDCDGLSNCNDPSCSLKCTETGARCNDDIDNDNDGLTDCDDPDCEDATACSGDATTDTDTGSDSSDTGSESDTSSDSSDTSSDSSDTSSDSDTTDTDTGTTG